MDSEPTYCPHPDKPTQARCPSCGRLLCSDCIRYYAGKCLCENCAPAIVKSPAPTAPEPNKGLVNLLLVVGVMFIMGISLGVFTLSKSSPGGVLGGVNQARMYRVGEALLKLKEDTGRFPTAEEGLALLVDKEKASEDSIKSSWYGPYLPKNDPAAFQDIYGQDLLYGQLLTGEYYIQSVGPDGINSFDPQKFEETKDEGDDLILLLGENEVTSGETESEPELIFGKPVMKGGLF